MSAIRDLIADAVDVAFNDLRKAYRLSPASMDFTSHMREAYEEAIDDLAHLAELWIEIELEE